MANCQCGLDNKITNAEKISEVFGNGGVMLRGKEGDLTVMEDLADFVLRVASG